jgi:hypothetical protein
MKIGIVPTKYGYNAVAIGKYDSNWGIYTPVPIDSELELIMKSEILRKLAIWTYMLSGWRGQWKLVIPWALWGGLALYLRMSNYASMGGWKVIALYGWIMFLFFGDGVFALGRWINQIPNLFRAWQIGRIKDIEIEYHELDCANIWGPPKSDLSEIEFIKEAGNLWPETRPYYAEMLRKEPPLAFSLWPLGLLGYVRYLTVGPRIPRPALVVELGRHI